MGTEIVHNQSNSVGLRIVEINEVFHNPGPVSFRTALGDLHLTASGQGLQEQEEIGHSVANIVMVEACRLPGCHRQRLLHFALLSLNQREVYGVRRLILLKSTDVYSAFLHC